MKLPPWKMTTAQFAKLHGLNKRTLHYYDEIGLFSPACKGENGYRYYDYRQSMEFEYIRMLKDLHMSIEEIKEYESNPSSAGFLKIADTKLTEIEKEIQRLRMTADSLQRRKEQLLLCERVESLEIRLEKQNECTVSTIPYPHGDASIAVLFHHMMNAFGAQQLRDLNMGCFLSLDKVQNRNLDSYDGLFTTAILPDTEPMVIPKGTYLCGYIKGDWQRIPQLYEAMCTYAEQHDIMLSGAAWEIGLNEFAISSMDAYVTKIMIKADNA